MSAEFPIQMLNLSRPRKRRVAKTVWITDFPPVVSRMPPDLVVRLDEAAKACQRSRSQEIVYRLQASFENQSIDEHGCIVVHAKPSSK